MDSENGVLKKLWKKHVGGTKTYMSDGNRRINSLPDKRILGRSKLIYIIVYSII